MKIIEKPWGNEILLACNDDYAAKIINVDADKRLSLQYHTIKNEVLYLDDGIAEVTINKKTMELGPGATIELPAGTLLRIEAVTDCKFLEVSTPILEDVIRIEDDYDRL
jgi:mannose-6-phosphate isomerase-like protein (cupin superfamily)